jgi:hypothetical protein
MQRQMIVASLCASALLSACGGGGSNADTNVSTSAANTNTSPPKSTFSGRVADKSGNPISAVTITVYLDNDHSEHVTTTDSDGHYTVSGLANGWPYGSYEIWAGKAGFAFLATISSGAGTVAKSDHNALFKTVIAIPATSALTVSDANFVALTPADKLVSLPRTGQSVSYVVGDDAALAKGIQSPTPRFIDNSDGTVSDALTGLVWLKDAGCFSPMTWSGGLNAAAQLGNGVCGLSDGSAAGQWRMPNIGELETLIDVSRSNPAVAASRPFTNIATHYWSSTTYRGMTTSAWVIRFTDGRYINDGSGNVKEVALNSVWAVKSGSTGGAVQLPATGQFIVYAAHDDASVLSGARMPYPRFIDNADGTVSDTVTGLRWLKRADCIHADWAGAIAAVNALASGQCGLSDNSSAGQWRMPNRSELLSLVDRAETNQALRFNSTFYNANGSVDAAPIFTTFHEFEFLWTSTTDASDATFAWTVFSCDYGVYDIAKGDIGYTLAVR